MLLGLVATTSASAKWVLVADTLQQKSYADPETVRRQAEKAKIWELTEFRSDQTVAGTVFRSMKTQMEYDCENELVHTIYGSFYSGPMGKGDFVESVNGNFEWLPVVPETVAYRLLRMVCRR